MTCPKIITNCSVVLFTVTKTYFNHHQRVPVSLFPITLWGASHKARSRPRKCRKQVAVVLSKLIIHLPGHIPARIGNCGCSPLKAPTNSSAAAARDRSRLHVVSRTWATPWLLRIRAQNSLTPFKPVSPVCAKNEASFWCDWSAKSAVTATARLARDWGEIETTISRPEGSYSKKALV